MTYEKLTFGNVEKTAKQHKTTHKQLKNIYIKHLYSYDFATTNKNNKVFKVFKCYIFKLHGLASNWEHQKRKVVTQIILYKIYWEILFQKNVLGYLLHFVQNGSSKNT